MKTVLVGSVLTKWFELVPHGLAGVAVLVELEHHKHSNQIPADNAQ